VRPRSAVSARPAQEGPEAGYRQCLRRGERVERALERAPRPAPEALGGKGETGECGATDAAPARYGLRGVLCHFKVNECQRASVTERC